MDRDHVVEARGRAEAEVRLADHDVEAALDHRLPAADRARAPQLGDGVVEVGQVVRVEDDPLRVALAVADAQLVDEVGHRAGTLVESGRMWGRTATELAAGHPRP